MKPIPGIEIGDLIYKYGGIYEEEIKDVGDMLLTEAENLKEAIIEQIDAKTIKRTGNLLGSVAVKQEGDLLFKVSVNMDYASFLEEGTNDFFVEKTRKDGSMHRYAIKGISPRYFFRDAVDSLRASIIGNLDRGLGELVSRRDVNFI